MILRILLLVLVISLVALPAGALEVGDVAPDFITEDLQGGPPITISGYSGQVVVLVFFWTS